jgi:hypothetical protein
MANPRVWPETEARHHGDLLGPRRLADAVRSLEGRAPSHIVDALAAEIHEFTTSELHDDLCILAALVGGVGTAEAPAPRAGRAAPARRLRRGSER